MEIQNRIEKLEKELAELKAELKTEYPMYKRSTVSKCIVKFTGRTEGEVMVVGNGVHTKGEFSTGWIPHGVKTIWEDVIYDEEKGMFDKQLVWCWNIISTHSRVARFYDAINKCSYTCMGERHGLEFDSYEPYKGEYPEWARRVYDKLED
jgi:hypothetical protein